jgi:hypothetical protein
MSKIFITGVAKSGTTLLKRMFFAFEDVAIIKQEVTIDDFVKQEVPNGRTLIGKRGSQTLLGCGSLPFAERERQAELMKDMIIINIVRHPNSVCKSYLRDFDVDGGFDWVYSVYDYLDYKYLIRLNIKYEDLIENPNEVQKRISEATGLKIKHKFSDYPSFFPDRDVEMQEQYQARKLEKIEMPERCNTLMSEESINIAKKVYGYE